MYILRLLLLLIGFFFIVYGNFFSPDHNGISLGLLLGFISNGIWGIMESTKRKYLEKEIENLKNKTP